MPHLLAHPQRLAQRQGARDQLASALQVGEAHVLQRQAVRLLEVAHRGKGLAAALLHARLRTRGGGGGGGREGERGHEGGGWRVSECDTRWKDQQLPAALPPAQALLPLRAPLSSSQSRPAWRSRSARFRGSWAADRDVRGGGQDPSRRSEGGGRRGRSIQRQHHSAVRSRQPARQPGRQAAQNARVPCWPAWA